MPVEIRADPIGGEGLSAAHAALAVEHQPLDEIARVVAEEDRVAVAVGVLVAGVGRSGEDRQPTLWLYS